MVSDCDRRGLAFIVEGATEKVFYLEYLKYIRKKHATTIVKDYESQEDAYVIADGDDGMTLVMFNAVNSVSQMTNSATWFHRACSKAFPDRAWSVFLCYDTDEYNYAITKFHEGDWGLLRKDIGKSAERIVDLAAKADIEDIILCDLAGVLGFLGLGRETPMPEGSKGKAKLKKLYRMVALNNAYHSGEKARPLIQALDMELIERSAPIPLREIEEFVFLEL